eukprot:TRINITY_DN39790_c0_g1_i1.p1 TRINITY_DN39790_c0_g1~~TRINITY_DN39790_c0_g1_i1.p1  ORF type:complete len:174 (-),score=5.51 TRINITY_DN39790_c0_g1_i1:217-738(-)
MRPHFQRLPEEVVCLAFQYFAFIDFFRLRRVSKLFVDKCLKQVAQRCYRFRYDEFAVGVPRGARRTHAERLRMFLEVRLYSAFFVEMDLVKCPKAFFDVDSLRNVFQSMSKLVRVVLPIHHLTTSRRLSDRSEDVKRFVQAVFPKGVSFDGVDSCGRTALTGRVISANIVVFA